MKPKLLLINGSVNGEKGQSHAIASAIKKKLSGSYEIKILNLSTDTDEVHWQKNFTWAQGFVFLTGTYWDSWGSPLQIFLEKTTMWETNDLLFGKPAGVIFTMHSVGGKGILSRLQGVLNTQGFIIPPLCGLVYSLNTHLISDKKNSHQDDFWHLSEIPLILSNIATQIEINHKQKPVWQKWNVDKNDVTRAWLKSDDITF